MWGNLCWASDVDCGPGDVLLGAVSWGWWDPRDAVALVWSVVGSSVARLIGCQESVVVLCLWSAAAKNCSGVGYGVLISTLGCGCLPLLVKVELTGDAAFGPDEIHKKLKGYESGLCELLVFPFVSDFRAAVGDPRDWGTPTFFKAHLTLIDSTGGDLQWVCVLPVLNDCDIFPWLGK